MTEVLDHAEVDALLAAIREHALPETTDGDERSAAPPGKEVRFYDFKRPERVSKDQIRALEGIHEAFGRNFGASLSGFLRTIIEVRVATIEQLTYGEFIHSLPNPTNFNLISAEPLEGQICLEISPLIIYPVIDRLLGGTNAEIFIPQRPLTLIELRLVKRITDRALQCLTEVWSGLAELDFQLQEVESNPHLVQIVAPNEVVVVIGFEIKMGARVGTMSLCLPFNVIEPVMSKLATQGWLAHRRRANVEDREADITANLGRAEIELQAFLAETTITVSDLLSLQPGDIIPTDKPANAELILQAEGRNKFAGRLGRHKEFRALKISRLAEEEERL
ncbi:MAG TPA: flagellar motor switch protein FliM [Phycisphaerae bacterium]|jgi:flagellar motor switch protein FliM